MYVCMLVQIYNIFNYHNIVLHRHHYLHLIVLLLQQFYSHFSNPIQQRFANTKESPILYLFASEARFEVAHAVCFIGFASTHHIEARATMFGCVANTCIGS